MTDVDIVGLGVWCESFSNWDEFCSVLEGGSGAAGSALKPEVIAPNERRRAPLSVKMAVEVMDQACRMAALEPSGIATVFASAIGDMQITDYMCRTLADAPRTISPTRFHNSVHNAATGYWSIATQSHSPASAVSGYSNSAWVAFLDGAIQAVEENIPVLVAVQEVAPPAPLQPIYEWTHPFAAAILLAPVGFCSSPIASVRLSVSGDSIESPQLPQIPGIDLSGNFAARSISLLAAIEKERDAELRFPLSRYSSLSISIAPGCRTTRSGSWQRSPRQP